MKYTYWSFLWNKQFHFQSNGAQPASHPKQWWKTINLFSIKKKEHNEPLSCWMIATVGHCLISLAAFLKKSSRMVSYPQSTNSHLSLLHSHLQPKDATSDHFLPKFPGSQDQGLFLLGLHLWSEKVRRVGAWWREGSEAHCWREGELEGRWPSITGIWGSRVTCSDIGSCIGQEYFQMFFKHLNFDNRWTIWKMSWGSTTHYKSDQNLAKKQIICWYRSPSEWHPIYREAKGFTQSSSMDISSSHVEMWMLQAVCVMDHWRSLLCVWLSVKSKIDECPECYS